MKRYKNHIKTLNSLTIIFENGDPVVIPKENESFNQIAYLLSEGMTDDACAMADIALKIETHTKGRFTLEKATGEASFKDEVLPPALAKKLVSMVDAKLDTKPLERFWANLKQNPSEESRKDLYGFLEANKIPITEDGHFIGYKKVRADYLDSYTAKIENKPGMVVSVPRESVDPNREQTCSHGLHVAAFAYAQGFLSDGKFLEVKVHPRDVVAVPPDYNQQKMRVCRYEVVGHATKERTSPVYSPKGAKQFVMLDSRGRLQIPLPMLLKAGLRKNSKVAVRVDPRAPGVIRLAPFKGVGLPLTPTRLGVYVPASLIAKAGLQNSGAFRVTFKRGGISLSKE